MKRALIVMIICVLAIFAGCSGDTEDDQNVPEQVTIKMGMIPADDAAEMLRSYQPIADYLSEELGVKIEMQVTTDYSAAIEAMRAKHIDMAWFGPLSYVLAADVANAEAIVNGVRRDTGKSTYKTIFVTKAGSGIESLEDMKGRSFAYVDPASTSGYLIPKKILIENEISDDDFSEWYYAGTHNAVQLAVANGKVDAGADSDNSYYRMVEAGEIDPEVNIIIHESEPIPGSPIAVRGDLPEELKQRIQQALVDMDQQTINKVDGWGDIEYYQAVSDEDYNIIRETATILDLDLTAK